MSAMQNSGGIGLARIHTEQLSVADSTPRAEQGV